MPSPFFCVCACILLVSVQRGDADRCLAHAECGICSQAGHVNADASRPVRLLHTFSPVMAYLATDIRQRREMLKQGAGSFSDGYWYMADQLSIMSGHTRTSRTWLSAPLVTAEDFKQNWFRFLKAPCEVLDMSRDIQWKPSGRGIGVLP